MPLPNTGLTTSQPGPGIGARTPADAAREQEQIEAARQAREEQTRRSEERLRALIRDICTGCDYGEEPARSRQNVVRAKG